MCLLKVHPPVIELQPFSQLINLEEIKAAVNLFSTTTYFHDLYFFRRALFASISSSIFLRLAGVLELEAYYVPPL